MPVPGDGDALIRITAAGVCHSDLHLARGEWMSLPPLVNLGHEAIGIVEGARPRRRPLRAGRRPGHPRSRWQPAAATGAAPAGTACPASPAIAPKARESSALSPSTSRVYARSLVKIPDEPRRPRGAARVRRADRLRGGQEAAGPSRAARAARWRSSAPPAGSATTRCSSRKPLAIRWSASMSARNGWTSSKSLGADLVARRR